MKILVTGGAGFTGSAVARGHEAANRNALSYAADLRTVASVADRPAMDPSRLRTELGWRPDMTVEEGLEHTVDGHLANEARWRPLLDPQGVGTRPGRA